MFHRSPVTLENGYRPVLVRQSSSVEEEDDDEEDIPKTSSDEFSDGPPKTSSEADTDEDSDGEVTGVNTADATLSVENRTSVGESVEEEMETQELPNISFFELLISFLLLLARSSLGKGLFNDTFCVD